MESDQLIGTQLSDRIRVTEFVEDGPYSKHYTAELLALKRPIGKCSVKLIFPATRIDPDELLSEIRTARLSHPSVPALQSSGVLRSGPAAGAIYLSTELADTTLAKRVEEGQLLTSAEAENMARNLLDLLSFLHAHGKSHGHLRPKNVQLVGGDWKAEGMDLATVRDRLKPIAESSVEMHYRAPESFESEALGPSGDLWSLGCVLHFGLTGKLPIDMEGASSRGDIIWRILNQPPQTAKLDGNLDVLVRSFIQRQPEERWHAERALGYLDGREPLEQATPEPAPDPVANAPTQIQSTESPTESKEEAPSQPRPPKPLYFHPVFLLVLMVFFGLGLAWGYRTGRPPTVLKRNVPPEKLYPVNYEIVSLDAKGRFPERRPGQSVGFAEDLGEGVSLEMVQVTGGSFWMGTPEDEPQREPVESPQHRVTVRSFYMSRYEITQQQWRVVASLPPVRRSLDPNPALNKGDGFPVESVSWEDTQEFCARLSRHSNRLYRLPTEAEWEYACRAGSSEPFTYGLTISSEVANYQGEKTYGQGMRGTYRLKPVDAGSLGNANAFGLYDMHGNVWEWCQDYLGSYPSKPQFDPTGPSSGELRVMRGGGWESFPWRCRSGARAGAPVDFRRSDLGIRVVLPETYRSEG